MGSTISGSSKHKKQKTVIKAANHLKLATIPHPFNILPLGNLYLASKDDTEKRTTGLGRLHRLPDELLVTFLAQLHLSARDLCRLSQCSQMLYAFSRNDDLWRSMYTRDFGSKGGLNFKSTWLYTYATSSAAHVAEPRPIRLRGIYSDVLYLPHFYNTVPLDRLCGVNVENIDRRSCLSLDSFIAEYGIPNKPVIITDIVTKWPAFEKWNEEYLLKQCGERTFRAEAIDLTMNEYLNYARQCHEEAPLYLFDKKFGDSSSLTQDFTVPPYFQEDMLALLGDKRPDYRWLIVGPTRSGSTFHLDPNSTSAYNAVIKGSKKWIMYPPGTLPPGVYLSEDGSEVTSPLSVTEWFVNFYSRQNDTSAVKPIECVCRAGEVIFVPYGWFHLVVNLEPSIALTQNFTSSYALPKVLDWLETNPEQVSGYSGQDLYSDLKQALVSSRPDLVLSESTHEGKTQQQPSTANTTSTWTQIQQSQQDSKPFSFAFYNDDI
ncbi:hypothetical protein SmJEL517_g02176 [Synchytrium microbalum]|uniref:JmjC domain-containing protein n=1 Tax=Synchytrium microbalum TaxID=1806994 RepID=A0A507C1U4_9FUNG|nr:uncharacterized protein SmJEL517_g02176 [Synchytrium microbalum]TPX35500.1 hypothetical protein SmJEL517_g02176 [Synchytrium microbalum]